jgi:hypothetical protein
MKLIRAGMERREGWGTRIWDSESIGAPVERGTGVRRRMTKKRHWAVLRLAN